MQYFIIIALLLAAAQGRPHERHQVTDLAPVHRLTTTRPTELPLRKRVLWRVDNQTPRNRYDRYNEYEFDLIFDKPV